MSNARIEWTEIRLVIFDVDGTLYRQLPVRLKIARDLAIDSARRRDLTPIRVLSAYRRIREQVGDEEVRPFSAILLERTAVATGVTSGTVQAIVAEWIETRPLRYLKAARYAGIDTLFAQLRRKGTLVAIVSDYPATAKMAALGLVADVIISATDPEIGVLKPNPRGIEAALNVTGVEAAAALFIGDRVDRDGAAARRAGVKAFIRSSKPIAGWCSAATFHDPVFDDVGGY